MRKIIVSLLSSILCCFYLSSQNQDIEKKKHSGWGFGWKFGYSQFIALNDFSHYLKGGPGIQTDIDILYKRFEFSVVSMNLNYPKARKDFVINGETVNVNDKVEVGMGGVFTSASYAVVYNDYLKISPLAGIVWGSLRKDENIHTKNLFTGTIGLQMEYNYIVTSLGGLTGGICLPLYLKYNYCFPRKYTDEINSGMHFITVGIVMYLKDDDK